MKLLMKFHAAMLVLCRDEKPVQIEQRPAMRTREVGPMGSSDKLRCAPVQLPGQVPGRFAAQVVWFPHQVPEVSGVRFWKVSVQCPGQVQEASGAAESQCMCSAATNDQKRFLIAAAVGIPSFSQLSLLWHLGISIFFFF
jgi:hypothetical protein